MTVDLDEAQGPANRPTKAKQPEVLSSTAESVLTLRRIDVDDLRPSPAATPDSPTPSTPSAQNSTFASIDWLDTIVDEMLDGSVRRVEATSRPPVIAQSVPSKHTEFADFSIGRAASNVLGQVVLGYSPIINLARGVIGTRLTVVPVRMSASIDAGALLEAVAEVWPAEGGLVSLNVASATLVADLLKARPTPNVMIEVPAFIAADPSHTNSLLQLANTGTVLLLKGRPLQELPREVLPCFRWSIVDLDDDRRVTGAAPPSSVTRRIPYLQSGVRTMAELRSSLARGAVAIIGWPLHEPLAEPLDVHPDMRVVLDAIERIDRGDPTEAIDHVLMRDPVLAFELLTHLNGPDQLRMETGSLKQAVSVVGRDNLRRWLVRLLSRSADDIQLRPANFAALRRGLLMRMLANGIGQPEARSEHFMCGVFSLLDRIYARPIGELVQQLELPAHVHSALVSRDGPFSPLLELVRAIESESPQDIRTAAEAVFLQPIEINRALLRSLLVASQLESGKLPNVIKAGQDANTQTAAGIA